MWAAESKNNNKEWFYFGQDKPLGPMNWKEILEVHKKFPQVFISKDNIDPKDTKKRINWLPAQIIIKSTKILAESKN
jgi:hypothetical protein